LFSATFGGLIGGIPFGEGFVLMAENFSRTLRALQADGTRPRLGSLVVPALFLAWAAWFLFGQVAVQEVTATARLEVQSAAHPVAAQVAGRIVETRLTLGRKTQAGEVLAVLDSEAERRALQEERTRRAALARRLTALRQEDQAEREALRRGRAARTAALAESRVHVKKAEAQARFADRQAEMLALLRASKAASRLEHLQSQAEAEVGRATVEAQALAVTRLEQEGLVQEGDRQTRLAKLEREAVQLETEVAIVEAAISRLEHDLERRLIRAPVSGQVGEAVEFPPGSFVRAGEKLGAIVPPGDPRAVAFFPSAAVGRIRPGQPARLRLTGFPWTQYGILPATVADVGNEASEGRIRVEFRLASEVPSSIPIEHGLPGSAEVEVERVAPALLVLRAAGQFLGTRRTYPANGGERGEP
jgi:membrane fusion protein (multidrug efflux system)